MGDGNAVQVGEDSADCTSEPVSSGEARGSHVTHMVDLRSTVYMLNPSGDLSATQAAFETLFRRQPDWQVRLVVSSSRPRVGRRIEGLEEGWSGGEVGVRQLDGDHGQQGMF